MNHDTSFIDLKWIHPPLHVKLAVKAAVWLLLLGIAGHDYYKKRVAPAQADPGAGGGNTQAARVEPTTAKCVPDRNGNGGETRTTSFAHPAVDATLRGRKGGRRPRVASDVTYQCRMEDCSTLAECAQACFVAETTGAVQVVQLRDR